ncbi:MAG: substrate-binding domain-containing protein, partial [Oscillospiraceae bacterium]
MKLQKKLLALLTCTAMLFSVTACSSGEKTKPEEKEETQTTQAVLEGVTAQNYPRVDGSTANMPLMSAVYSKICGVPLEKAEDLVQAKGTAESWRGLSYGESDLLLVYEAPETVKQEIAASETKLEAIPIGKDALVFLVNAKNTVNGLTQDQLRDIYTGKLTDWKQVGGEMGPIAPFQRNEESGSQTMFLKLLMKDTKPMVPKTELVQGFMGSLIDGVASYDGSGGAMGYSVFYYANEMNSNPNLKLLAVDG